MQIAPLNRHKGRLFVVGDQLLDTTGSTPMGANLYSRLFWTAITGEEAQNRATS